ncbi:MAG: ABC transporter ATP-binding protein [Coriobacteriia bacterium]|nr:ABC transporter ATP-binding protein [Coriobacteriia bacterium]
MSSAAGAAAPATGDAVLVGEGLRKAYARTVVLDAERVEVPRGGTLAVLGPSGSGKSTLLAILGLLLEPDGGRVLLDGREVAARDRAARGEMAAVFQRPYLFKDTVARNVGYGLRLRRVPAEERSRLVTEVLASVGLAGWEDRSALRLSGGEAQRVALARALVLRPRVLLLDEPLASLDPVLKARLTHEFSDILRASGASVVWVTHDQGEAMTVADRVAIMREGRVVAHAATDEVMGLPSDEWTAAFLGLEPAVAGEVRENAEGLLAVEAGGVTLYAVGDLRPGERVELGVRPEDVLLFEAGETLPVSSARNRLDAVVEDVTPRGTTFRVGVRFGGVRLAASVSRASARDLSLAPGTPVLAVFKATAVRVRPARSLL